MKLKAWHILLILLVFAGLLLAISSAGKQWRLCWAPDMLRVSNAGDLYVSAHNRIFIYDKTGVYRQSIELSRWGIEQATGGFAVFSNGDLLLLEGTHHQGPLLQLLTFLRMEKLLVTDNSSRRRLVRCSLVSGQCRPLSNFTRTFTNTFRVQIDSKDRIFLADTKRDTISWLDADGRLLDEISKGFRFPNQVYLEKNPDGGSVLLVANTNRNEVTAIPLHDQTWGDEKFAAETEWLHLPVDSAVPKASGHIWPLDVVRVGAERFVLQQGDNMGKGLLVKYDSTGKFVMPFTMPDESDAMAVAWFGNELLVADDAQMKIWRYNTGGVLLGDFSSPELAAYLQTLMQQKLHYQALEKQWWWLFKLLLVIGFVAALIGEKIIGRRQQQQAVEQAHVALAAIVQEGETVKPLADDPAIHWLGKNERSVRLRRLFFIRQVCLLVVVMIFNVSGSYAMDDSTLNSNTFAYLLLIFGVWLLYVIFAAWQRERNGRKIGIGVLREWIILRDKQGNIAVGREADVLLFFTTIAIGGIGVQLGLRRAGRLPTISVFDGIELQQWLAPRLIKAQEKPIGYGLGWYIRYHSAQSVLLLAAVLLFFAINFL